MYFDMTQSICSLGVGRIMVSLRCIYPGLRKSLTKTPLYRLAFSDDTAKLTHSQWLYSLCEAIGWDNIDTKAQNLVFSQKDLVLPGN